MTMSSCVESPKAEPRTRAQSIFGRGIRKATGASSFDFDFDFVWELGRESGVRRMAAYRLGAHAPPQASLEHEHELALELETLSSDDVTEPSAMPRTSASLAGVLARRVSL
jgi:hypothetical protein